MTRETKIGLLVGLAFIIVIGILLSDHLSSTNEPLGAPLRVAGDSLRSGLGQPGSEDVAPMLKAPTNVVLVQPVVTNEELNHHTAQPPVHFVSPPVNNSAGGAITPNPVAGNNGGNDRLRQIAQQHGEELVPVNPNGNLANNKNGNNAVHVDPPAVPLAPKQTARTYVAQSGDSLGSIAMKAYGSGNKTNREAIVAANPGLAANRDLIVAGRTYIIPALGNTPVAQAPTPAPEKPVAVASLTYTVKPHDTLWSIALNEVGNPNAVAAIKELNQDVLNGSERLRPNMKLTLPAKKSVE